jgi:hypothetical protein
MLEHAVVRTRVIVRVRCGPLGPSLDDLTASLPHEGYAPSSLQRSLRAAEPCAPWRQGRGDAICQMADDLLQCSVSGLTRYPAGKLPKAAQGLGHLSRLLHQHGVRRSRHAALPPSALDPWWGAYDA